MLLINTCELTGAMPMKIRIDTKNFSENQNKIPQDNPSHANRGTPKHRGTARRAQQFQQSLQAGLHNTIITKTWPIQTTNGANGAHGTPRPYKETIGGERHQCTWRWPRLPTPLTHHQPNRRHITRPWRDCPKPLPLSQTTQNTDELD